MPSTQGKTNGNGAASTTSSNRRKAERRPASGTSRRKPATMRPAPKALSLHIGLNSVSPKHYAGWSGELLACEFDARDMEAIAKSKGMQSTLLLTRKATREAVLKELRRAAKQLRNGDLFFLTYSGHGGQVPDHDGEEQDRRDETWCLYDGQLIDDELYLELGRFAEGVRILALSDSCHSGTVVRAAPGVPVLDGSGRPARVRLLPPDVAWNTYERNKDFYDRLQRNVARAANHKPVVEPDISLAQAAGDPRLERVAGKFRAALILIAGCQDNQTSLDGDRNGAFTEQLLRVWRRGAFIGDYTRLHVRIRTALPPTQTPNLFTLGDARTFLTQHPFQVSPKPLARVSVASARKFVAQAAIPAPKTRTRASVMQLAFDTAMAQAVVVGSDIVSFVPGVTPERREAIVNSSLLAQLVASTRVADPTRIPEWYETYFDVLTNVGWVIQDRAFAEYRESGENFEAHKAIVAVATTLLGAAPTALAVVTTTLESLRSMDESSPWITIFSRESQSARTARFQVSLAEQDADGQFIVNLLAFALEARSRMTQILFFRAKRQDATLRHYSGRVTINTAVLDGIGDALRAKLIDHAADYVKQLPDLHPAKTSAPAKAMLQRSGTER